MKKEATQTSEGSVNETRITSEGSVDETRTTSEGMLEYLMTTINQAYNILNASGSQTKREES